MAEPLLNATGLRFDSAGASPVDGIDLAIREGDSVAVMGANGAGKSLLLRLLHGLIRPSAGTILWRGRPPGRAAREAQAMVFQRPVLLRRSVRANLRFALAARGIAGAERAARAERALARARLVHLAGRPARLLSAGEQQRLAIARALATAPELLFLDEPTASLDPASALAVEALIRDAHEDGVAIVLVTHDSGQALRLAGELVFLDAGRVAETGALPGALRAPRSEAARAWVEGRLYAGPAQ